MMKIRHFSIFLMLLFFIGSFFDDLALSGDCITNSENITQFELDVDIEDAAEHPFHFLNSSIHGLKRFLKNNKKHTGNQIVFFSRGIQLLNQNFTAKTLEHNKNTLPRFSKFLTHTKTKNTLF